MGTTNLWQLQRDHFQVRPLRVLKVNSQVFDTKKDLALEGDISRVASTV